MSNFIRRTKNPRTGQFEWATWLDNFFPGRCYGVTFPSNEDTTTVHRADEHEWEFDNTALAPEPPR